jgi:hypothetical protein
MARKSEALAGAGGKPPFGGGHDLLVLADGPEPRRGITDSLLGRNPPPPERTPGILERFSNTVRGAFGKRQESIFVDADARPLLTVLPKWSEAQIAFPSTDNTLIVGLPSYEGSVHIVEVSVPVLLNNGPPNSLFLRAISWFKNQPSTTTMHEMNSAISNVFKTTSSVDVNEALVQYKTLMKQQFGADKVLINLIQEGSDIIVTKAFINDFTAG